MKVLECLRIDPGRYLIGESRRGIRPSREMVVGIYLCMKKAFHVQVVKRYRASFSTEPYIRVAKTVELRAGNDEISLMFIEPEGAEFEVGKAFDVEITEIK